jgi:site-specific DNA-methyltransferase (adenine-specific)
MENAGFHFGQMLFWLKTSSVLGRLDYLPSHELIFYGWYKKHVFRKSKDQSILVCPKPQRSPLHSTMKPVSLLRRLILNNTKIGDVIYDPFLGSGSCILAAEQTKRRCIAVEISPDYCRVAAERFRKLTGIEPKVLSHLKP